MSKGVSLTAREKRGLRFLRRTHPYLLPLLIAILWLIFVAGTWYEFSMIVAEGEPHGIFAYGDVLRLAEDGFPSKRMIDPFEAFAISEVESTAAKLNWVLLFTVFAVCVHFQNGMILRLWQASAENSQ